MSSISRKIKKRALQEANNNLVTEIIDEPLSLGDRIKRLSGLMNSDINHFRAKILKAEESDEG